MRLRCHIYLQWKLFFQKELTGFSSQPWVSRTDHILDEAHAAGVHNHPMFVELAAEVDKYFPAHDGSDN